MKRKRVVSSAIAAIGYDATSRTLEVEFVSGRIYQYREVEATVFRAFMSADSKGSFFMENIRNDYPDIRVR